MYILWFCKTKTWLFVVKQGIYLQPFSVLWGCTYSSCPLLRYISNISGLWGFTFPRIHNYPEFKTYVHPFSPIFLHLSVCHIYPRDNELQHLTNIFILSTIYPCTIGLKALSDPSRLYKNSPTLKLLTVP